MTRKLIVDAAVFMYILLFVYAALTKLLEYQKFAIQIGQSPMLTDHATLLAWAIPFLELAISTLLIIPFTRFVGLHAAFGMMVMFTTYIILASRFSDYVPCSCGGVLESMTWTQHLIFNVFISLLGLAAIMLHPRRLNVHSTIIRS